MSEAYWPIHFKDFFKRRTQATNTSARVAKFRRVANERLYHRKHRVNAYIKSDNLRCPSSTKFDNNERPIVRVGARDLR